MRVESTRMASGTGGVDCITLSLLSATTRNGFATGVGYVWLLVFAEEYIT